MRVLIDTNVFISRENHAVVPDSLQRLLSMLHSANVQILVHPLSVREIQRNRDEKRKTIELSKIKTYAVLEEPPDPAGDAEYAKIVGKTHDEGEVVDHRLLYCVHRNAVDFLISEDKEIHRKSQRLGISHRVLGIGESLDYLGRKLREPHVTSPPAVREVPVYTLDINDPIFDSIKGQYPDFEAWWAKISREGRKAWVYRGKNARLGAILIYKKENEAIASNPPLPKRERVKICTFKVSEMGRKIGELFVKLSVKYAVETHSDEIYITIFPSGAEQLIELIREFGFQRVAEKNGEQVHLKRLVPDERPCSNIDISTLFYPSYYDGPSVRKFIVPILPEYHNRLFTEYERRQPHLTEYTGELIIEGNTIKKAYLCRSRISRMYAGDILVFYRSKDEKALTSVGVVERARDVVGDAERIMRYVRNRTVYSKAEIEAMAKKPTKVILFKWHFHFPDPLRLEYLLQKGIVRQAPMSIVRVAQDKYLEIKKAGGLDARFTVG
jgi:rRNA-processing protein FCF1